MSMLLLAESMIPNLLMAAGAGIAVVVVMGNLRRRSSRTGSTANLTAPERVERIRQQHGMSGDLRQMMVELEDLTRRFSAQLDAKTLKLERLLDQADQKIALLEQASERNAAVEPTSSASPAQALEADASPEPDDPLATAVYRLADDGKRALDIARELDEHVGKVELILALRQG